MTGTLVVTLDYVLIAQVLELLWHLSTNTGLRTYNTGFRVTGTLVVILHYVLIAQVLE